MHPLLPAPNTNTSILPSTPLLGILLLLYELEIGKWKSEGYCETRKNSEGKNLDTNLCSPLHQQDDLGLVTTSLNFSYRITKIGLKCLFCWVLNHVMYLKHLALSIYVLRKY